RRRPTAMRRVRRWRRSSRNCCVGRRGWWTRRQPRCRARPGCAGWTATIPGRRSRAAPAGSCSMHPGGASCRAPRSNRWCRWWQRGWRAPRSRPMPEFAWPWLGLALPLPLLLRALLPPAREAGSALHIPFLGELATLGGDTARRASRGWLPPLAWLLLCLAAMRPVWVGEVEGRPVTGRDLLLAVDVSGSMAAEDMLIAGRVVSRLSAVKVVLGDFLERRVGDRVGLLLFGQRPYLVTPLTFDRGAVRAQLHDSQVGIAGRETAIGDAIGLAVKRLREQPQEQRVLVLLTDGVNTAGVLEPLKAAELAR